MQDILRFLPLAQQLLKPDAGEEPDMELTDVASNSDDAQENCSPRRTMPDTLKPVHGNQYTLMKTINKAVLLSFCIAATLNFSAPGAFSITPVMQAGHASSAPVAVKAETASKSKVRVTAEIVLHHDSNVLVTTTGRYSLSGVKLADYTNGKNTRTKPLAHLTFVDGELKEVKLRK